MDDAMKARLTSRDLWMRLLYMIFFAITYSVAELIVVLTAIFQFIFILFSGSANEPLLRLGQNLTRYIADIVRFQTFNTEEKPFPFADWPDEAPGGDRWSGPQANAASAPTAPSADAAANSPASAETPAGDRKSDANSGSDAEAPTAASSSPEEGTDKG